MAINISKFNGIPTTVEGGIEQFEKLYSEEKDRPFNRGRFLVLKINETGKYKGLPSTFVYEKKPKNTSNILRIRKM